MTTTIDIHNQADVFAFIVAKLTRIGWKIEANAKPGNKMWLEYPNYTARFFSFSYQYRTFTWSGGDESDYGDIVEHIETMEDARQLMEFIEDNGHLFVEEDEMQHLYMKMGNSSYISSPSSGKSYYQAAKQIAMMETPSHNYLNEINELTQKCDQVISLKKSDPVPKTPLKDVIWDTDALDAKLGAMFNAKASAALDEAMDEAYEQHYKKCYDTHYELHYQKHFAKAMDELYEKHLHKSMVNWCPVNPNPIGKLKTV